MQPDFTALLLQYKKTRGRRMFAVFDSLPANITRKARELIVANLFNHPFKQTHSLIARRKELDLQKSKIMKRQIWKPEEEALLKSGLPMPELLIKLPHRQKDSIRSKITQMQRLGKIKAKVRQQKEKERYKPRPLPLYQFITTAEATPERKKQWTN